MRRGDAIATLNPVLRGWTAYFRLTEVKERGQ
ncbi:group II intron maturase-specific domain-containing protein [Paraburkholderia aspalathi]